MALSKCPECGQEILLRKIKRIERDGYCYHQCYKCQKVVDVTPAT